MAASALGLSYAWRAATMFRWRSHDWGGAALHMWDVSVYLRILFKRTHQKKTPVVHTVLWAIPRRPPPVVLASFVVSTFGSLGAQAQTLIKDIGRRTNFFVPFSLAHETSWATSSITTFDQLLPSKSVNV